MLRGLVAWVFTINEKLLYHVSLAYKRSKFKIWRYAYLFQIYIGQELAVLKYFRYLVEIINTNELLLSVADVDLVIHSAWLVLEAPTQIALPVDLTPSFIVGNAFIVVLKVTWQEAFF